MNFTGDSCRQNSDGFPSQFLSMPDLDTGTTSSSCDMELLAGFNSSVDQGIIQKPSDDNAHSSLNCVLPSINHDQIDDEPMIEVC